MTIQFVCHECGQWMEAGEDAIGGDLTCPQCGEPVPVPEEDDRPLAEGACFYCGEAVDRPAAPEEAPTCAACRESIAENDYELEQERLRRAGFTRVVKLVGFVLIALFVLYYVGSLLFASFRQASAAPRAPVPLGLTLSLAEGGPA